MFHKSDHPQIIFYSYKYAAGLVFIFILFFILPRLFRNKRSAENYLLIAVSLIAAISSAEIASRMIIKIRQAAPYGKYGRRIEINLYNKQDHADLGYVLGKNDRQHAVKSFSGGKPVYDVVYNTDEYGRRTTGGEYLPENRHLILFGCSLAFGIGLNDKETLQHMLAEKMPGYNVYNYAVFAYGPQQMLALLETGRLPREVESDKGTALYLYYNPHIDRAVGSMRAYWVYNFPYYRLDKYGRLEKKGTFVTGRRLITRIYDLLGILKYKSAILQLIDFALPLRVSAQDIRLTAEIIKHSRDEYERQFNGKFYVVIYPLEKEDYRLKMLTGILRENGIGVFYYPLQGEEYVINGDNHPNARLNEFLSDSLARDLEGGLSFKIH